jgi:RND family efflux transporter MFP subunit
VDLGQHVKAGQLLARLDAQDYRLAADAARAQVDAATTQRDLARADVARYRTLREKNFISAAEMERREAQLKGAQAQLDQARAQLATQTNQAGYTQLVADAAGVVTGVDAEVGQVVAAGAPVVRLARDGERDAVFAVPEDQLPAFRTGMPMAVRSWASGQTWAGTVREVAASADPVSRTFAVKVALDVPPAQAPALGATVSARLAGTPGAGAAPAAIKLPTSAIREQHGKTQVWVLAGEGDALQVKARDVAVAGLDGNEVLVAQGLQSGERVVVAGVHVLGDGQKVRVYTPKNEENPTAASNTAEVNGQAAAASAAAASSATAPASATR